MRRDTPRPPLLVPLLLCLAVLLVAAVQLSGRLRDPDTGPAPVPTPGDAPNKERLAQLVLDGFEAAVAGRPPPPGLGAEIRRKIAAEVGPADGSHTALWEPLRPVVWEEAPPPDGYEQDAAAVMRATLRGGRGRTEDPSIPNGVFPYDLAGTTFEVLLESRGGEWAATDLAYADRVDGR